MCSRRQRLRDCALLRAATLAAAAVLLEVDVADCFRDRRGRYHDP